MSAPVVAAHHAACPQAYHHYLPQGHQQQQQQHQPSWPDHYRHVPNLSSPMHPSQDGSGPAMQPTKLVNQYRDEWPGSMRQQTSGMAFSPYSTGGDLQDYFHHGRPASGGEMSSNTSTTPYSFVNPPPPASSQLPSMPSPPPSDGSPRVEWAGYGATEVESKTRRLPQLRFNHNSPVLRPDGIRKKNAKFEIPEERTLDTLDELIKVSKDEYERKELKMQKRLLRNREAALHSRQKKKVHAEGLERENNKLLVKINEMQHEMTGVEIQMDDLRKERELWKQQLARAEELARRLEIERDAESKERLRLSAELEQLRPHQAGRAASRSPAAAVNEQAGSEPSTSAATPTYADPAIGFGECGIAGPEWPPSNYDFMNDMCLEPTKLQGRADDTRADVAVH